MADLLDIDGSILEGGGQILRISIALSALLCRPIRIKNIRAGRKKPGLASQHLTGIKLVSKICGAELSGAEIGSTEVTFRPSTIRAGHFVADAITAGSTGLLAQVSLPVALFANGETVLDLKGGTNADQAPPIDFTINVFRPMVKVMGIEFQVDLIKRGYFPKGGGHIRIKTSPILEKLKPILLNNRGTVARVQGCSFAGSHIRNDVEQRMAVSAEEHLKSELKISEIDIELLKDRPGSGVGICLHATTDTGVVFGVSELGRKGVPAEDIGKIAATSLIEQLKFPQSCVDEYLQDQLIIFMALAEGHSKVQTGPVTLHTETAIHICEKMTGAKFTITPNQSENIIECDGIGFKLG